MEFYKKTLPLGRVFYYSYDLGNSGGRILYL